MIGGLTVGVLLRDDRTVDPAVAGNDLGAGARNFCGKASGSADPILGGEFVAQGGFHRAFIGREGAGVGVNHGHVEIAGEPLLVDQTEAHGTHVAGVVGKHVGEIVRKIIGTGNGAVAENGGVSSTNRERLKR